jgi:hypothetical protein
VEYLHPTARIIHNAAAYDSHILEQKLRRASLAANFATDPLR